MRMGADKQQKADDEKDSTSSGQMSSLANVSGKCRPALLGGKIPSESEYPGIISHLFHALKCRFDKTFQPSRIETVQSIVSISIPLELLAKNKTLVVAKICLPLAVC